MQNVIIKFFKTNQLNFLLIISFFVFVGFYLFNFDYLNNKTGTDFWSIYKPNGIIIIDQIISLDFRNIDFLNFYFLPELITGILFKVFQTKLSFYLASDLLNMMLLFLSFKFFFESLNEKNNNILFIFFLFFFSYIGNWTWCFWKTADIYFLFVFSLIFYFLTKGITQNKFDYIFYSLLLCFLSLITKPQGLTTVPFFVLSICLLKYFKNNFFLIILILFLLYILFFPLLLFIITEIFFDNFLTVSLREGSNLYHFFTYHNEGRTIHTIFFTYEDFIEKFNFLENNISKLIYYYYQFLNKLILQLTFVRETYSLSHNIFLFFYIVTIYFFLIINSKHLINQYSLFFKLTTVITFFAILLYCSTFVGEAPNRFHLFHLVPLYILVSISLERFLKKIFEVSTTT